MVFPHAFVLFRFVDTDILYFAIAPCLVYDLNFPRNGHFRLGFFVKCFVKFVLLSAVVIGIVEQYILPIIKGAMTPMEQNDQWSFLERLLLLSIPNLIVWILGFYVFFHVWLNMFAELLAFADRRLVVFTTHACPVPSLSLPVNNVSFVCDCAGFTLIGGMRILLVCFCFTTKKEACDSSLLIMRFDSHIRLLLAALEHPCPRVDGAACVSSPSEQRVFQVFRLSCHLFHLGSVS